MNAIEYFLKNTTFANFAVIELWSLGRRYVKSLLATIGYIDYFDSECYYRIKTGIKIVKTSNEAHYVNFRTFSWRD
uniref:Uncharacterized protein n=1 Tax=Panagrolaimus sp. JU765 TaxID=591449 RepID=A0AC34QJU3_9BILA